MKTLLAIPLLLLPGFAFADELPPVEAFCGRLSTVYTLCSLEQDILNFGVTPPGPSCFDDYRVKTRPSYEKAVAATQGHSRDMVKDVFAQFLTTISELPPRSGELKITYQSRIGGAKAELHNACERLILEFE